MATVPWWGQRPSSQGVQLLAVLPIHILGTSHMAVSSLTLAPIALESQAFTKCRTSSPFPFSYRKHSRTSTAFLRHSGRTYGVWGARPHGPLGAGPAVEGTFPAQGQCLQKPLDHTFCSPPPGPAPLLCTDCMGEGIMVGIWCLSMFWGLSPLAQHCP